MADMPHDADADAGDDARAEPARGSATGPPRWWKVFVVVGIVVVLLFVVVLLVGGHGPGRHTSSGGVRGPTTSSSVAELA